MTAVLALLLAAAFGAGDQYLGSFSWMPWGADVSLLSAPWLLIAFLGGWSQPTVRRAVLVGLGATIAALVGYGLMTLSPVENAHLTVASARAFLLSPSQKLWFTGGLATGPLFGWLGNRWRTRRSVAAALAPALAVALEPLVHGHVPWIATIRFRWIELAEVAVGCALAAAALATARLQRR